MPGYVVASLDTQVQLTPAWQLFASIGNLFNRAYQNFGLLGANAFTGPGRSFGPALGSDAVADQFRGLGSPRGFWIGVHYGFGGTGHAD